MKTIGDWTASPSTCTLEKDGRQVKVTPRNMDVLNYLAENAGSVVSSRELLDKFWPAYSGSDHAVHKSIAELRAALGDQANRPRYIKTISKRGYTLIAPIDPAHGSAAEGPSSGSEKSSSKTASAKRRLPTITGAVAAVLVCIALASVATWPDGRPSAELEQKTARLAVLPFVNRADGRGDQFLANGLTESLLNGLSKLSNLAVVSPGRVMSSGNESSPWQVGQALDANHLLQGSIQSSQDQLRVTVRLIRAEDGVQLYSDQFDTPRKDLFEIQDQIASNIVRALSIHLNEEERSQMLDWGTTNALAYEQFLRGEFHYNQFSLEDFERAIDHHLAAIELDPDFLNAYHGAATAANNLAVYSKMDKIRALDLFVSDLHPEVDRIAPDSDVARSIREIRLRMSGNNQVQQELQLREQILSGDPPDFAMAHYALLLIGARLYEEALHFLERAQTVGPFEISPDEIWSYRNLVKTPHDIVIAGKKQLQQRPNHVGFLGTVATNLALLGDLKKAELYLKRQRNVDTEGILVHHSEVILAYLSGEVYRQSPDTFMGKGQDFHFNNGVLSFMLGDIEAGMEYWRSLEPVQMRRVFNVVHSSERFFSAEVLEDPRYQALLEEIGAGKTWQRQLMEGVVEMEPVTGVRLSEKARTAYKEGVFMSRNNLWTEEDWKGVRQLAER